MKPDRFEQSVLVRAMRQRRGKGRERRLPALREGSEASADRRNNGSGSGPGEDKERRSRIMKRSGRARRKKGGGPEDDVWAFA
jgi:hypothetical protein